MKGLLILIAVAIVSIGGFYLITQKTPSSTFGGFDAVQINNATSTGLPAGHIAVKTFVCGVAGKEDLLSSRSGRSWFRISNHSATGTITFSPVASSGVVIAANAGIVLSGDTTTSTKNYFDSGESNITWEGLVKCYAAASTSVSVIETF